MHVNVDSSGLIIHPITVPSRIQQTRWKLGLRDSKWHIHIPMLLYYCMVVSPCPSSLCSWFLCLSLSTLGRFASHFTPKSPFWDVPDLGEAGGMRGHTPGPAGVRIAVPPNLFVKEMRFRRQRMNTQFNSISTMTLFVRPVNLIDFSSLTS